MAARQQPADERDDKAEGAAERVSHDVETRAGAAPTCGIEEGHELGVELVVPVHAREEAAVEA